MKEIVVPICVHGIPKCLPCYLCEADDALCDYCGHSYAQHSKGPVIEKYCRHCVCPEFKRPAEQHSEPQ